MINTPNKTFSFLSSVNVLNFEENSISTPSLLRSSPDNSLTISEDETNELFDHDKTITFTTFRENSDSNSDYYSSTNLIRLKIEKPLENS